MVALTIEARGVKDPRVLAAMRAVPRHAFVPEPLRPYAYDDRPLPIGEQQTISQPYIVALMTELADVAPGKKVLEVGTGSGYQAAILAQMGAVVYSIEIVAPLAERARATLASQGYAGIHLRAGDGYAGWKEAAPFDAIVVTAAPDHVPQPLIDQLAVGGRLIIPVGASYQELIRITRGAEGMARESIIPVRFVPMTGEAQRPRP
jgi:protein-L-isoaspartate(D-aspartate) O-methyltransferase